MKMATELDKYRTGANGQGAPGNGASRNRSNSTSNGDDRGGLKEVPVHYSRHDIEQRIDEVRVFGGGVQSGTYVVGRESETRFLPTEHGYYPYVVREGDNGYEVVIVQGKIVRREIGCVYTIDVDPRHYEELTDTLVRITGIDNVFFEGN